MRLKALCLLACLWPLWVWAAPYSSPTLERERLLKVTLGALKKLHLEPQTPPQLELTAQGQFKPPGKTFTKGAVKLKDGRVTPSLAGQLGAQGFQTVGLKLTLTLSPLTVPQEAELRGTLAQVLGQPPQGEWLQLVAPGAPAALPPTPEPTTQTPTLGTDATGDLEQPAEVPQTAVVLPS